MSNPYTPPQLVEPSRPEEGDEVVESVSTVIAGQRMLICAILAYFAAMPLMVLANVFLDGPPEDPVITTTFVVVLCAGLLALFGAAASASVGIFRMGAVLYPGSTRYIYAIGVLLPAPLVGLIVMLVANSKATRYLRAKNITVGFFGAQRGDDDG